MFPTDSSSTMLYFCLLVFGCFELVHLFPSQKCNAENPDFFVVLDCQGEHEEQKEFIETFSKYWQSNTRNNKRINREYSMMKGKKCLVPVEAYLTMEFQYNETQPIPLVLNEIKAFSATYCKKMSISIIFLYNINNINNKTNPTISSIINLKDDNTTDNIFFIIQSSEKPSYLFSSMDFVHFTPSFQDLNISEIFYKICNVDNKDKNLLFTYSINTYITSNYRIVNQLSEISSNDAGCYCRKKYAMQLLSLETYTEFLDILKYIYNLSITNVASQINLHLGINLIHEEFYWSSHNTYLFSHPISNTNYSGTYTHCFYLNLTTSTFPLQEKNLYNLGKYMTEIECKKPLENSLVVCESGNVISDLYVKHLFTQLNNFMSNVVLTRNDMHGLTKFLSGNNPEFSAYLHIFKGTFENNLNNKYLTKIDYKIKGRGNSFVSVLISETEAFFSLVKINISECQMYKESTNVSNVQRIDKLSNLYVESACTNNKIIYDKCSIPSTNLNLSLEYVKCESNKTQNSIKCIKNYNNQCEDNSHLQNCENFICPVSFFKCIKSYCILHNMVNDGTLDCPHGEDEILFFSQPSQFLCSGSVRYVLKEMCLDLNSFDTFVPTLENNTRFVCDISCPENYKCVSSQIEQNFENKNESKIKVIDVFENILLFKKVDVVMPDKTNIENSHLYNIVFFYGQKCNLNNFDFEFQYWNFDEIILLDISYNVINHSNFLSSIERFSKLSLLNLSNNENLIIDEKFNFPKALEIIDLSHTKINAFRKNVFGVLKKLRHLNVSHTLITQFNSMGLPEYFILDTLYIENVRFEHIETNLFKGLTIYSALVASDFVICCPQILNSNISEHKCHAPIDVISSCKHLVGDTFKRFVIWIIGFLTISGNGIVLIYRISWNREIFKKAYGIFITGLAISDFIMGVYLMIIASVDVYYKDVYVLDEFNWRNSFLCNLCGFLSTFSSETSTFFICLITLDRFLCITYPFGEHRFSKTGKLLSFSLVLFIGFVLALIPVILSDWEIYSSNGLCLALPLSPSLNIGWTFSFVVFVGFNFLLFFIIAFGQLMIVISLIKVKKSFYSVQRNNQKRSEEWSVAKKLALVAFSDFCCWFPVGILGFLSLNGYIFNREVYAWIAVFVLPINSALNPIIYTIPAVYSKCRLIRKRNSVTLHTKL